ncbi:ENSP00000372125-like, partial [Pristimantis euphronides]
MSSPPHPAPLLSDPPLLTSGFAPRGIHRMVLQRPPYTEAKLELMGRLRSPLKTAQRPPHTLGYLTWLEVGRLPPLLPLRQSQPQDSTVWRQITAAPARPRPQGTVPPPSRMDNNTWAKFIHCAGIRRNEAESRALQIRSQGRAPSTGTWGNILPPEGFRRYKAPGITAVARSEATPCPVEAGLYSAPQFPQQPRTLTQKKNCPKQQEILQEYRRRGARSVAPNNSRRSTPRAETGMQDTRSC